MTRYKCKLQTKQKNRDKARSLPCSSRCFAMTAGCVRAAMETEDFVPNYAEALVIEETDLEGQVLDFGFAVQSLKAALANRVETQSRDWGVAMELQQTFDRPDFDLNAVTRALEKLRVADGTEAAKSIVADLQLEGDKPADAEIESELIRFVQESAAWSSSRKTLDEIRESFGDSVEALATAGVQANVKQELVDTLNGVQSDAPALWKAALSVASRTSYEESLVFLLSALRYANSDPKYTFPVDGTEDPLQFSPAARLATTLLGVPTFSDQWDRFLVAAFAHACNPTDRAHALVANGGAATIAEAVSSLGWSAEVVDAFVSKYNGAEYLRPDAGNETQTVAAIVVLACLLVVESGPLQSGDGTAISEPEWTVDFRPILAVYENIANKEFASTQALEGLLKTVTNETLRYLLYRTHVATRSVRFPTPLRPVAIPKEWTPETEDDARRATAGFWNFIDVMASAYLTSVVAEYTLSFTLNTLRDAGQLIGWPGLQYAAFTLFAVVAGTALMSKIFPGLSVSARQTCGWLLSSALSVTLMSKPWSNSSNWTLELTMSTGMLAFVTMNINQALSCWLASLPKSRAWFLDEVPSGMFDVETLDNRDAMLKFSADLYRAPARLTAACISAAKLAPAYVLRWKAEPRRLMMATPEAVFNPNPNAYAFAPNAAQAFVSADERTMASYLEEFYGATVSNLGNGYEVNTKLNHTTLAALSYDFVDVQNNSDRNTAFRLAVTEQLQRLRGLHDANANVPYRPLWIALEVALAVSPRSATSALFVASVASLELHLLYMFPLMWAFPLIPHATAPLVVPRKGFGINPEGCRYLIAELWEYLGDAEKGEFERFRNSFGTERFEIIPFAARLIEVHFATFRGSLAPGATLEYSYLVRNDLRSARDAYNDEQSSFLEELAHWLTLKQAQMSQFVLTIGAACPLVLSYLCSFDWLATLTAYASVAAPYWELIKEKIDLSARWLQSKELLGKIVNVADASAAEDRRMRAQRLLALLCCAYLFKKGVNFFTQSPSWRRLFPAVIRLFGVATAATVTFASTLLGKQGLTDAETVLLGGMGVAAVGSVWAGLAGLDTPKASKKLIAANKERLRNALNLGDLESQQPPTYGDIVARFRDKDPHKWTSIPTLAAPFVRLLLRPSLQNRLGIETMRAVFGEPRITSEGALLMCRELRKLKIDHLEYVLKSIEFVLVYATKLQSQELFLNPADPTQRFFEGLSRAVRAAPGAVVPLSESVLAMWYNSCVARFAPDGGLVRDPSAFETFLQGYRPWTDELPPLNP